MSDSAQELEALGQAPESAQAIVETVAIAAKVNSRDAVRLAQELGRANPGWAACPARATQPVRLAATYADAERRFALRD